MRLYLATIFATASVALLVAACGGSASNDSTTSLAHENGALAFARCMRNHGLTFWPDPTHGQPSKPTSQQLSSVPQAELNAAEHDCRHLLLTRVTRSQYAQQLRARDLSLAHCMRAHGIANFPDPGSDGHFPHAIIRRLIAQGSTQFRAATRSCRPHTGPA